MGNWSDNVERWRQLATAELERQKIPLPVDLVLAVIHVESRGRPGATNPKSGASGLMQVMEGTLGDYNKANPSDSVSIGQLRSGNYPAEQIRVGLWVMAQYWKSAYKYLRSRLATIPLDELGKIADLFYVAGPGGARKHLDNVEPPFFDQVAARYPSWNALPHPRNVWKAAGEALQWDLPAISEWLETAVLIARKGKQGIILLLCAVLALYWFFVR